MKQVINILILGIMLSGCNRQQDPVLYTEDKENGLRKTVEVGDVIYDIQYKPPAYIARLEHLDKAAEEERIKALQGMAWFNVSFKIKDFNQSPLRYKLTSLDEYTARQNYFLNEAPKDMYMLYGKDTLYVNSYWFENNQNLSLHETMVVGFKLPGKALKPEEDLRFSFYDRVHKNGIIKAIINKGDLLDVPEL
jgi:hypothetical protein